MNLSEDERNRIFAACGREDMTEEKVYQFLNTCDDNVFEKVRCFVIGCEGVPLRLQTVQKVKEILKTSNKIKSRFLNCALFAFENPLST